MKTTKLSMLFMLLGTLLLSPACEYLFQSHKPSSPECEIGEPFRLSYGQSAECPDWAVTFTGDIQDSRCPTSVTCVWAGRVDVTLQVGDEFISLGLPDDAELGRSKATIDNRVIELLEVLPVPVEAGAIPQSSYRIKLSVSEP